MKQRCTCSTRYVHMCTRNNRVARATNVILNHIHSLCYSLTAKDHNFVEVSRPGSYLHYCASTEHWQVFNSFKISKNTRTTYQSQQLILTIKISLISYPFNKAAAVELHSN